MQESHEKRRATRWAPSFAPGIVRCTAKHKQELAATYPRKEPYARMSARTDLCGGGRATGLPTATDQSQRMGEVP